MSSKQPYPGTPGNKERTLGKANYVTLLIYQDQIVILTKAEKQIARISVPLRIFVRFRRSASPVTRKIAMVTIPISNQHDSFYIETGLQLTRKTARTQNLTSPVRST
ncbi:hypothetical protein PIIN_08531 [Serendipita indica DSM 11827]|uniref:Uncharacterized protein n=1 Tax=Serendipita indica (strain DSM 11827) TaxID=1109443 RepID=G4TTD6_SERID|nr:hypothetical protein PIIN_08531 [Serendipita indica DSM 11827]